ncbi:molybdopterin oxidoreductase family protein [Sciscionella sediminilitoris]|uniref:molybdopterin oxidoreductase family protein n=1 Tax=Sciscionella sediminilitoris TaxID=1445613 RepID=UPI00068A0335|nr:molybdopterin oxidoreductase family protein [Sciscionella sp. SE31]
MRMDGARITAAEGGLCQKGWTAAETLNSGQRLRNPLVRTGGRLRPASWDSALDLIAERLATLRAAHGPDTNAVFGGGGLTNEKAYLLGKFARLALGTARIDYNGRFCMSAAAKGMRRAFGIDRGLPFPLADLGEADAVLLIGANPAETMPPFLRYLRGARENGGLIVADPRRTATAEQATLHLAPAPGTDLALALGMLHAAVTEGLVDQSYVDDRTAGFEEAWRIAADWWPERAELVTGVAAADQRRAVRMLAAADRAYVLTARGTEQHADGTATVHAWINLALALGLPGTPGSGFGCLTGQGNGQGGREHGQKSDQLPGYRDLADPAARAHIAGFWGISPEQLPAPGPSAYELLNSLGTETGPRSLLVFGSNPVVSAPDAARITGKLAALDFLVVADLAVSATAELADVVLPVTQWAEETGTMTNLEGRVLLRARAVSPPAGVRSDLEILAALAHRLGQPRERFPSAPEDVFTELRAASAGGPADYAGISYPRLRSGAALHWPVPHPEHAGTPRLFLEGFAHPDGRAVFHAEPYTGPAEPPDTGFPLQATTGRILRHYQSGTQTRMVPELADSVPRVHVEMHPETARRAGLAEGAPARVSSRRGSVLAEVRCIESMRLDLVFLPFHFPGAERANLLTDGVLDPECGMPEFKVCAVRLDPAGVAA